MKNATEFYENSLKKHKPSPLMATFFRNKYNEKLPGKTAVDIGCGAGNDTVFLLKKGFKVTAIDSEPQVEKLIKSRVEDTTNLEIITEDFSKISIPKADLIFANFSLFFVKKDFDAVMKNILENINKNGFFVGNFLGEQDEWQKSKTLLTKEQVLNYFSKYKITYFSEEKYYKDTITKKQKFWHVYTIIAQKKFS